MQNVIVWCPYNNQEIHSSDAAPGNKENTEDTSNTSCASQSLASESVELIWQKPFFVFCSGFPVYFIISFTSIKQQKNS